MRIIAGSHRGRRIAAPPGRATRPMLDRVREALFSTLGPWLEDGRVLDLYAGSGSLGLEALSRGAREARFVERDPATAALLERNVRALGLEERARVLRDDALAEASWGPPEDRWDVVLLDPPYPLLAEPPGRERLLAALERLARTRLAPEGVLVLHTPRGGLDSRVFPAELTVAERDYGTNRLWFLQA